MRTRLKPCETIAPFTSGLASAVLSAIIVLPIFVVPDAKPVMDEIIPPPGPAEAVLLAMVTLRKLVVPPLNVVIPPPPQVQPEELPEIVEFAMLTVALLLTSPPPPLSRFDAGLLVAELPLRVVPVILCVPVTK